MIRLLMLDADRRLIAAVTRALAEELVQVASAESIEGARDLALHGRFDAALLDGDAFDLRALRPLIRVPAILTTAALGAPVELPFADARVLHKPFTNAQLCTVLRALCSDVAPVESSRLLDVLRRAHSLKQTCALRIGSAELFIRDGEIIHATSQQHRGEAALLQVLAHSEQPATLIANRVVPHTIQRSFQILMFDMLRTLEERERAAMQSRSGVRTVDEEKLP